MVGKLEEALLAENRGTVEKLTRQLTAIILEALEVEPVTIKVLSARPSDRWGELHGLYEGSEKKTTGTHYGLDENSTPQKGSCV